MVSLNKKRQLTFQYINGELFEISEQKKSETLLPTNFPQKFIKAKSLFLILNSIKNSKKIRMFLFDRTSRK